MLFSHFCRIIKEHPNSYTFTKNLAEHEVKKANVLFPTAIVRPSMSKYSSIGLFPFQIGLRIL